MEKHNFDTDVIKRSFSTPVLVDFWAPWCGACSILSPALELLHERHRGEWVLVKINVEKYPVLAEKYRVASIPTVMLFIDGEVVDSFAGAIPGHVIEAWLRNNLSGRADANLKEAEMLYRTGQREKSLQMLSRILEENPDNRKAEVLYALQTVVQDPAKAKELVSNIEPVGFIGEIAEAIRILSQFIETKISSEEKSEAAEHFDASALAFKSEQTEKALQESIETFKIDKNFMDGKIRDILAALLIYAGEESGLAQKYRKELFRIV